MQAPRFVDVSVDPFSLSQNVPAATEVGASGREALRAPVVAPVFVVLGEGVDLLSEITWRVVVFQLRPRLTNAL